MRHHLKNSNFWNPTEAHAWLRHLETSWWAVTAFLMTGSFVTLHYILTTNLDILNKCIKCYICVFFIILWILYVAYIIYFELKVKAFMLKARKNVEIINDFDQITNSETKKKFLCNLENFFLRKCSFVKIMYIISAIKLALWIAVLNLALSNKLNNLNSLDQINVPLRIEIETGNMIFHITPICDTISLIINDTTIIKVN